MPYHAGLSKDVRATTLANWVAGRADHAIVVATTAFGMGIDKDNVRFVAHWAAPKSFEGYYQEAGRCGRDGRAGLCLLYYSREDRDRVVGLMSREFQSAALRAERAGDERRLDNIRRQMHARAVSFQALVAYCEDVRCRHKAVCEYFGTGEMAECNYACDVCKDPTAVRKEKEKGLASEEWCSTQRQTGAYDVDEYDYDI
jgi:superfamily II DNA helicase RecQ